MATPYNPFEIYDNKEVEDSSVNPPAGVEFSDLQPTTPNKKVYREENDRLPILFGTGVGILLLLIARMFFLQVVQGAEYQSLSEGNRIRLHALEAPRGVVFDSKGTKLVSNVPNFEIRIIPSDFTKDENIRGKLIEDIAWIIQYDTFLLEEKFDELPAYSFEPTTILEGLSHEQALKIIMKTNTTPGLSVVASASRKYDYPNLYGHILGYTGKISEPEYEALRGTGYHLTDKVGKTGLEFTYETTIRGLFGLEEVEVNSLGIEQQVVSRNEPTAGKNLILGIDNNLQRHAYKALSEMIESLETSTSGVVIAMDPRNGAIRAMVSIPNYDNNDFIGGIDQKTYSALLEDETKPLYHRAISGTYPSGSTIKPLISSAALEEGIITENTSFLSTGGLQILEWFFPDWKGGGHGNTDVRKAIAESVNTFYYIIGGGFEDHEGLGIDRIRYYGNLFGLGSALGVDLPNEAGGFLPSPDWKERTKNEQWYIGDTYHAAIGQGDVLVTPIQLVNYICAIANGGTVWQPRVVEYLEAPDGSSREPTESVMLNEQVVSEYTLQVVREGMRQAVTDGSARGLQDLSINVAAKTGTAQLGGDKENHGWITTFAPYENPELVLIVLVENGGEGSDVALPIARTVNQAYFDPESLKLEEKEKTVDEEKQENIEE